MPDRRSIIWSVITWMIPLVALCSYAVIIHEQHVNCSAAGGHVELSLNSRTWMECVRDGVVIHP